MKYERGFQMLVKMLATLKKTISQVWRTDLINARRPEFENLLADFLLAEDVNRNGGNAALKKQDALVKARKITKQIVDEDGGVNLPREKIFNDGDGNEDFFKQRMLRLDQYPEFTDPLNQKRFLGGFLRMILWLLCLSTPRMQSVG